ncbi:MAG: acyltransferase family protein [Lachnospiraceae bacterium]|nr:acyltransferase family protein [Lachnospiraceae bacterium]
MGKREGWIDCARVCAILCVVLCHATESFYGDVIRGTLRVSSLSWLLQNTLFTIGRLGVPLFLAITGALLLGRELGPLTFYRRSLVPMLVTTELWIVLNYLFVCTFQDVEFRLLDLVSEMCFLRTLELSHMWYMPMIIGVYIALPFLSMVVRGVENVRDFRFPYLLGMVVFLVLPTVNVFLGEAIPGGETLKFKIELDFLGGCYGLYLFGGYLIARCRILEKIKSRYLLLMAGLAFVLNTSGQYFLYVNEYYKSNRLLWYSSVCIFVMGLLLFEWVRRKFDRQFDRRDMQSVKVITYTAKVSFGIYLLHKPILILSMKYLPVDGLNVIAGILILMISGFGLSLLMLYPFWRWWKGAGKVFFLIKE